VYTLEQIMASPKIENYLTKLQCCPTSDGAAAAIVVSQSFLDARPHLKDQAILIAGQCMATDTTSLYSGSAMDMVGYDMTKIAAKNAMKEAGVTAEDVKVCELHDCFSANEMVTIDSLGLCEPGKAHEMVRKGDITYGGKMVINPSGGLISKGHPLGATGLAQCAELVWQLRGWANNRLVKTKVALQHNLGLGGAVVVTVYKRGDGKENEAVSDEVVGRKNGLGYNPAVVAQRFTKEQAESVRRFTNDWALGDTEKSLRARI
jgi:sterol carrier protein 2